MFAEDDVLVVDGDGDDMDQEREIELRWMDGRILSYGIAASVGAGLTGSGLACLYKHPTLAKTGLDRVSLRSDWLLCVP